MKKITFTIITFFILSVGYGQQTKVEDLQKITKLNSVTELNNYIKLHPEDKEPICINLQERIGAVYNGDNDECDYNLIQMLIAIIPDEPTKQDMRNTTFETNHFLITGTIHNHIMENKAFPTMSQLAQELNLSRQTIYNHLKDGLYHSNNDLVVKKQELMMSKAMERLYYIGIEESNPTALKDFIKLQQKESSSSIINNYIQINNLKISTDEIQNLPIDDLMQIEAIIQKTISN